MAPTIRHAGLTAGACIMLAAASCGRPPTSHHRPVPPALAFTIRMAGTSYSGRPSGADSIYAQFHDGVLRFELPSTPDSSRSRRLAPRLYVLMNVRAQKATAIIPASRQYWETRLDSVVHRAQSRRVISDIDVSGSTVGSGGTVNGYATTRYRITTRYTDTRPDISEEARKKVQLVEDVWVPDALKDVTDPIQTYLHVFRASGAVEELAEKQATARRKLFTGLPIRTVWVSTQTVAGMSASTTVTLDILDLRRVDVDHAAFQVPEGYARLDLAAHLKAVDQLLKGARDARKESAKGRTTP